jgi:hypothetical protein
VQGFMLWRDDAKHLDLAVHVCNRKREFWKLMHETLTFADTVETFWTNVYLNKLVAAYRSAREDERHEGCREPSPSRQP